ncbi:MAG: alpha-amylase family protein [Bacteroidales bacterium]
MQTNLREIDAQDFDVDQYVQSVLDASVNIVLLSVGGQVANYPTKLPFHYKNPYMKGDLVGEVVKKLNENGVKVMARFDFARINESIALKNTDWLYVSSKGEHVHDNGHYLSCINGDYQQKYGFEILKEAISSYPFDAIFFNAAGYTTRDYSENYHGICQCKNCKKRFRDSTGLELPKIEDINDPVFREYNKFRQTTHTELNGRITRSIQELNPNLVLSVYNPDGGIWRSESGTGFTSGQYWTYHATENVKRVLGSFNNRAPYDTYNHLLGMDYRHTATSPEIGRIFMPQQMLNGGALGIYFIGHLDNQYDRVFIPKFKELTKFHKTNEKLFTNIQSQSKIGLVLGSSQENRGIMRMLIEEHIMFDLIFASALKEKNLPRELNDYELLILSDITNMDDDFIALIDDYVERGGKILATGFPGVNDEVGTPLNRLRLEALGVLSEYEMLTNPKPSYLVVSDNEKALLGNDQFKDFDLIMMNSNFLKIKPVGSAKSILRLVPTIMHGPPEKCYFNDNEITDYPGVVYNTFGAGKAVFIPWQIGSQYNWKGNNAHRALFLATLDNLLEVERTLVTDAPPLVEMTQMINRNGSFEWIGMINHTGQIGNSFHEPVQIINSAIRFKPQKPVKEIYSIRSGERLKFKQTNGWVEVVVPKLDDFEMIVSLYK